MRELELKHIFSQSGMVILGLGWIFAFILFYVIKSIDKESYDHQFQRLLQRDASLIQREIDLNLEVIRSVKHLYESSDFVSRNEFKKFVSNSLTHYPSIQALEWVPKVYDNKRELYEEMASVDLLQSYTFKELNSSNEMVKAKKRAYYFPIYYVEPLQGNENVLGYDLSSNDLRLNALLYAANSNRLTVSSKIQLVQKKGNEEGILVINPVWLKENSQELRGFILGVYSIGEIIKNAISHEEELLKLDMWLVNETDSRSNPELLYTNFGKPVDYLLLQSKDITVENQRWKLYARLNSSYSSEVFHYLPHIAFFIVIFIALLINYIMAIRFSKEANLKQLVEQKTQTIEEGNRRYASLLQMFDKKVIASKTDVSGKITYVTQAFCKISGYSEDELLGRNHNIVRHNDMPSSFYEKLWKTIHDGKVFVGEIKNKRKDGTSYWVLAQIEPEFNDEGKIKSFFAIREDITAKKELEELNQTLEDRINLAVEQNTQKDKLLVEQSKLAAMGEMIGAIAHQWRQPLNTLAMKIQFLEDDYEDEILDKEYLKEFSSDSMKLIQFMSKTIDDFRNFFILDKEKIEFDVYTKIQDTTSILEAQLKTNKISLMITGESFRVLGFPNEFQQVILNIVNNSKDAMLENRTINGMISIVLNAQEHEIIIKDNAGGIPEDVLPRIFEPYFTTKEQGKGTGLGLYMSKMIIEDNMHGKITVFNESGGAKFIIRLGENNE